MHTTKATANAEEKPQVRYNYSFYIDQEIAEKANGPEGSMRAVVSDKYIGWIAEVHDGAEFCGIAR